MNQLLLIIIIILNGETENLCYKYTKLKMSKITHRMIMGFHVHASQPIWRDLVIGFDRSSV